MRWTALVAAVALAGCSQRAEPIADDAWVRLPAVPGRPAAGYLVLRGGAAPARLVAARSARVTRIELHETVAGGMRSLRDVPLPANAEVRFAPGGKHLMLFGIAPAVAPGQRLALDLVLDGGAVLPVEARVVGAADPAP